MFWKKIFLFLETVIQFAVICKKNASARTPFDAFMFTFLRLLCDFIFSFFLDTHIKFKHSI